MIDFATKWAAVTALVWVITRRVPPAHAAAAHRIWLVVLAFPVFWAVGAWLLPPVAYLKLREGVAPAGLTDPDPLIWTALVSLYLVGAFLLLGRAVHGVHAVRRLVGSSRRLAGDDARTLEAIAPRECEIREASIEVPLTAGFIRPVILLPACWRSLPRTALEAIVRHEAAHVRRHDCVVALACALIEAAFWFHPAVWLATSRVRWFAELACDEEAARAMEEEAYAAELLTLADGWRRARRPLFAITAGAETNVGRRIRLLLEHSERTHGSAALLTTVTVLLVLAVPLAASLRLTATSPGIGSEPAGFSHTFQHGLSHRH